MVALLMITAALAGPMRCEAVFAGPVGACELSGSWSATGVGRNEAQAARFARQRLTELIEAAVLERGARGSGPGVVALEHAATCTEALEDAARVHCFPEDDLGESALCLTQLPGSTCWRGLPLETEGPAWKATEQGREQMCELVAEAQSSASELRQLTCQVECVQRARTSCLYED